MFRIFIYGKENLIKFRQEIGFLHPIKRKSLNNTIKDFVDYSWDIKNEKNAIKLIMLNKARIKKPYILRVFSKEENNLVNLSKYLKSLFGIQNIKINKRFNGFGTKYFELSINNKDDIQKLIKQNLINPTQLAKLDKKKLSRK